MDSPYLVSEEAAAYCRFPSHKAFLEFTRVHGCSGRIWIGSGYRYTKAGLDAWMKTLGTRSARNLRRSA